MKHTDSKGGGDTGTMLENSNFYHICTNHLTLSYTHSWS